MSMPELAVEAYGVVTNPPEDEPIVTEDEEGEDEAP